MKLVWDEPKRHANIAKHGFDFADLPLTFFGQARIEAARNGRYLAIGDLGGTIVVAVVFRPLGTEALSIISMRRAGRTERRQ